MMLRATLASLLLLWAADLDADGLPDVAETSYGG